MRGIGQIRQHLLGIKRQIINIFKKILSKYSNSQTYENTLRTIRPIQIWFSSISKIFKILPGLGLQLKAKREYVAQY